MNAKDAAKALVIAGEVIGGSPAITYADVIQLVGYRLGQVDLPCPSCGPSRRDPRNRIRRVLRIWHRRPGLATYYCARCGLAGAAHDRQTSRSPHHPFTKIGFKADQPIASRILAEAADAARRRAKALALWRARELPRRQSGRAIPQGGPPLRRATWGNPRLPAPKSP